MFPAQATDMDNRGLFLCDDEKLRSRILPIFCFNPLAPDKRPTGLGTAFRIDPWSRCATAFHVGEDLFTFNIPEANPVLKKDISLVALDIGKLGYGNFPIPENAWQPVSELHALCGKECLPISTPRIFNVSELMVLRIQPAQQSPTELHSCQ